MKRLEVIHTCTADNKRDCCVIEELQNQLEEAERVINFYATKSNWFYSGMCSRLTDKPLSAEDIIRTQENWYDRHSNITKEDLEYHNDGMKIAGLKARQYFRKMWETTKNEA